MHSKLLRQTDRGEPSVGTASATCMVRRTDTNRLRLLLWIMHASQRRFDIGCWLEEGGFHPPKNFTRFPETRGRQSTVIELKHPLVPSKQCESTYYKILEGPKKPNPRGRWLEGAPS